MQVKFKKKITQKFERKIIRKKRKKKLFFLGRRKSRTSGESIKQIFFFVDFFLMELGKPEIWKWKKKYKNIILHQDEYDGGIVMMNWVSNQQHKAHPRSQMSLKCFLINKEGHDGRPVFIVVSFFFLTIFPDSFRSLFSPSFLFSLLYNIFPPK